LVINLTVFYAVCKWGVALIGRQEIPTFLEFSCPFTDKKNAEALILCFLPVWGGACLTGSMFRPISGFMKKPSGLSLLNDIKGDL
jgi:hypothetical protein